MITLTIADIYCLIIGALGTVAFIGFELWMIWVLFGRSKSAKKPSIRRVPPRRGPRKPVEPQLP